MFALAPFSSLCLCSVYILCEVVSGHCATFDFGFILCGFLFMVVVDKIPGDGHIISTEQLIATDRPSELS